mgnify:CR=1 FL=1
MKKEIITNKLIGIIKENTTFQFIIIIILAFTFSTCEQKSKEELILGKWQVDSIMSYYKGEKRFFVPELEEKHNVGAIYNPRIIEFNEFSETVEYKLNGYTNKVINFYEFLDDYSKIKFSHGKKGDKNYYEGTFQIEKLESDQLQYSATIDEMFCSRMVQRYYLSKVKKESYSPEALYGKWIVKQQISYMTGEGIEIDTSLRQVFEISDNNFKLYYDSDNDYEMNCQYKVKDDSLLIDKWLNFHIFKCNKNKLVLMLNGDSKLSNDLSGVTMYFVKIAERCE